MRRPSPGLLLLVVCASCAATFDLSSQLGFDSNALGEVPDALQGQIDGKEHKAGIKNGVGTVPKAKASMTDLLKQHEDDDPASFGAYDKTGIVCRFLPMVVTRSLIVERQSRPCHDLTKISSVGALPGIFASLQWMSFGATPTTAAPEQQPLSANEKALIVRRQLSGTCTTGAVTTLAGSGSGVDFADGTGGDASFRNPEDVAYSPDGSTIAVADYSNSCVRLIDVATGAVTTLAGATGAAAAAAASSTAPAAPPYSGALLAWRTQRTAAPSPWRTISTNACG
jgi:hypothetical protein